MTPLLHIIQQEFIWKETEIQGAAQLAQQFLEGSRNHSENSY